VLPNAAARFARALTRYTIPLNGSGHPSLTLPCGFTAGGAPLAMQLVARQLGEKTVLAAGAAYQAVTAHHRLRPPLA
jgi:Asp-tRNA(Asn)/Glu-tRNA(Gln) amidotransferase A subunit family amidase